MSGKKVYGRAYPITREDAKAYRRVDRSLRANPIGVTSMSSVNGRGSARSARSVAQGKTRGQRIARALQVYKNGEHSMAGILKNKRGTTKKRASSKTSRKSSRRKVPGTGYYRTSGGRYQDAKGKYVSASKVKSSGTKRKSSKSTTKRTTSKTRRTRRTRRNASVGYSPSYSKGYDSMQRSKAAKKAARTRKRKTGTTKRTNTIGKYTRVQQVDPKTGRKKLSYMYKTKSGKLRRIPTSAITRSGHKSAAEIKRGRSKAAARIKREGGAFVANKGKGKGSARQRRAGRRLAAYMAARRQGKNVAQAKQAALKKVPLSRGDQFKGEAKAPVTTGRKRTRVRRNKAKSKATKSKVKRVRQNAKRKVRKNRKRVVSKRSKSKLVANPRRKATKKRTVRRKRAAKRKTTKGTKRRKRTKKGSKRTASKRRAAPRRQVRRRKRGKSTAKRYRKNAFMANLKAALMTGLFVTTGYLTHRIITNLVSDKALATVMADNQAFQDWKKPLVGAGVLLIGIPAMGALIPKRGIEIGAGMVASFLQSVIVSALSSAGQGNLVSAVAGYGNSRAYALRGTRRRRGVRGMESHATSIGPRYTPVRGLGQYQQAAAGYQQAAAGQFQQAAAGEYFTASGMGEYFQASGMGEYFAPQGIKGVGSYEAAGQLAMQASAGTNVVMRDGIRPDSDLDYALDLAEAAAGLGEVPVEHRVGQQSQWIPNGPLWAGERAVTDSQKTSEIAAGILQYPGGNGILSGG